VYWDVATGRTRTVATLAPAGELAGLRATADGQAIVYGLYRSGSDLMMIEHFR